MKNKISLYILILTIFFSVESFSKTIEFISDNIKVLKNGDLINSFNGKAIDMTPRNVSFDLIDGDQPSGVISLDYIIIYQTSTSDLST